MIEVRKSSHQIFDMTTDLIHSLLFRQADEDKPASPVGSPSQPSSPVSFTRDPFSDEPMAQSPINSPGSPGSGTQSPIGSPSSGGMPWRRGHQRQQSLGTTKTSPSTRRRSLENTMNLIKDVVDGRAAGSDSEQVAEIADTLSSPSKSKVRLSFSPPSVIHCPSSSAPALL